MKITKQQAQKLLGESWADWLHQEFNKKYMQKVMQYVAKRQQITTVYPDKDRIFRAYRQTPFDEVRVVIVGQDPYYNGLADGLAFSTDKDTVPASLLNIFKEVESSTGIMPDHNNPDLSRWATQGVFLINTALTVDKGDPGSHSNIGWEKFVGRSLWATSLAPVPTVYFLWGSHAKGYRRWIENADDHHLILEAYHPSPLSATRGFFGCDHFQKANEFLTNNNLKPIDWR